MVPTVSAMSIHQQTTDWVQCQMRAPTVFFFFTYLCHKMKKSKKESVDPVQDLLVNLAVNILSQPHENEDVQLR